MAHKTFLLKIALKGIRPQIWRRVLVPSNITLPKLHNTIQVVMGWENYHLHIFHAYGEQYAPKELDVDYTHNSSKLKLDRFMNAKGDIIEYEYDFGDGWMHKITLEKVYEEEIKKPICVAGKRNCPPEDCGGVWGYADMLEALADPKHPEHEDIKEWYGDDFDPEYFSVDAVNASL
ncbi:MAG: plasmid pRiA4b ORF-3 family protein [Bacteroidetes bacterium]|nr:plasmid pRiA4b ORF-3 family protein [Bacteroidota bacterium]